MELNKAVSFVPTLKSKRRIHDPTCENPECNSRKLLVPTFGNRQNLGTIIMCCYLGSLFKIVLHEFFSIRLKCIFLFK